MSSKAQKKPGLFARMSRYFRDMVGEMKKVVWPTKKTALNSTLVVIVVMVVMALVVWVIDMGLGQLLQLLFRSF